MMMRINQLFISQLYAKQCKRSFLDRFQLFIGFTLCQEVTEIRQSTGKLA